MLVQCSQIEDGLRTTSNKNYAMSESATVQSQMLASLLLLIDNQESVGRALRIDHGKCKVLITEVLSHG